MKIEEHELERFLNDRREGSKRFATRNNDLKSRLTKVIKSRHIFKVAIIFPVLAVLILAYSVDRSAQQKGAALAEQAIKGRLVNPAARGNPGLTALSLSTSKGTSNTKPSLEDLQSMSTSALASTLQSTSTDTIQSTVLSHTGRQVSSTQVEKAQSSAGNSSILSRVDSARQSYSGSRSEAISKIRSKMNN